MPRSDLTIASVHETVVFKYRIRCRRAVQQACVGPESYWLSTFYPVLALKDFTPDIEQYPHCSAISCVSIRAQARRLLQVGNLQGHRCVLANMPMLHTCDLHASRKMLRVAPDHQGVVGTQKVLAFQEADAIAGAQEIGQASQAFMLPFSKQVVNVRQCSTRAVTQSEQCWAGIPVSAAANTSYQRALPSRCCPGKSLCSG